MDEPTVARTGPDDAGPGCGHDLCLFDHDCLVTQAETELEAARADRLHRRAMGRTVAHCLGLGDDEGRLFEVVCYSPNLSCRIAAGELLCAALWALAECEAA